MAASASQSGKPERPVVLDSIAAAVMYSSLYIGANNNNKKKRRWVRLTLLRVFGIFAVSFDRRLQQQPQWALPLLGIFTMILSKRVVDAHTPTRNIRRHRTQNKQQIILCYNLPACRNADKSEINFAEVQDNSSVSPFFLFFLFCCRTEAGGSGPDRGREWKCSLLHPGRGGQPAGGRCSGPSGVYQTPGRSCWQEGRITESKRTFHTLQNKTGKKDDLD